jgi:hypothetical protein
MIFRCTNLRYLSSRYALQIDIHVYQIMQVHDPEPNDEILNHILNLIRIFEGRGMRALYNLHILLDEFERLMQNEPRAKALITLHVASTILQLSTLSEFLHQLHDLQLWAHEILRSPSKSNASDTRPATIPSSAIGYNQKIYKKFYDRDLFKAGYPNDGKFYYPAERYRTPESVCAMIAVEGALDAL